MFHPKTELPNVCDIRWIRNNVNFVRKVTSFLMADASLFRKAIMKIVLNKLLLHPVPFVKLDFIWKKEFVKKSLMNLIVLFLQSTNVENASKATFWTGDTIPNLIFITNWKKYQIKS
jgi:hypothetical protein